jgi:hypothetical protein
MRARGAARQCAPSDRGRPNAVTPSGGGQAQREAPVRARAAAPDYAPPTADAAIDHDPRAADTGSIPTQAPAEPATVAADGEPTICDPLRRRKGV